MSSWFAPLVVASLLLALATASLAGPPKLRRVYKKGLSELQSDALVVIGGKKHLSASQSSGIIRATQKLLTDFDPRTHFFVMLGRDPAPITAALQIIGGKDLAVNMPASSNHSGSVTAADLEPYVKKMIPKEVLESDRTLVFVDVTTSGRALLKYVPLFAQTSALAGKSVKSVAFGARKLASRSAKTAVYNKTSLHVIDTAAFPEIDHLPWDPYEGVVSEFPRHVPGSDNFADLNTPLKQYSLFKGKLQERMERDPDFDDFLRQFVPDEEPEQPAAMRVPSATAALTRKSDFRSKRISQPRRGQVPSSVLIAVKKADSGDALPQKVYQKYLENREYAQFRDTAYALLQHGGVEPFYVGVGRSSSGVLAVLESSAEDLAGYLPIDRISRYIDAADGDVGAAVNNLRRSQRAEFFETFDAFLPRELLTSNRDIILFHKTESGKTLQFVQTLLDQFLASKNAPNHVRIVGLADKTPDSGKGHVIDVSNLPEMSLLNTDKYHAIAAYEATRPGKKGGTLPIAANGQPNPPREQYVQFKEAVAARVAADPDYQRVLNHFFGQ